MADEAKDNVHLTTWVSARQLGADHDVPDVPLRISPQTQHIPKVLGRYRLSRLLGTGGMGLVYEATTDHMPGTLAVKTLTNLSPEGLLCFKQEFRRTAALSHPHLVSLYELGHDAGLWFFSMELIRGRHLLEHVWNSPVFPGSALAVEGLRHPLPQLLDALEYLHSNGVLHLDVKPANVLVTDDGSVKLLDFGLSASEASADSNRFAGTPGYMAPEQFLGDPVDARTDLYALGCIIHEMATGQPPYAGQPGYGYGQAPSGPPPKRTGPVVMIVLSALAMIGAPIIGILIGIGSVVDSAAGITDGAPVTNGGSVDLPANTDRVIYFAATSVDAGSVDCTVTGPNGQTLSTYPDTFGMDLPDDSAVGVGFRTATAGAHTIDCDLPAGVNTAMSVGPPLDAGNFTGAGVAVLVGFAVGFLGLVLLIIGIVWLVRVNKRIRTGQY